MIEFGLIGYPLKNTFSVDFFTKRFKMLGLDHYRYCNYPLGQIDEFNHLLSNSNQFRGFNITIPFKQSIMPFLDELSEEAKACGAVNCIEARYNASAGKYHLKGFNTDIFGFRASFEPMLQTIHHKSHALIFGTGGSANAVAYALRKMGIPYKVVSRSQSAAQPGLSYADLDEAIISSHLMLINCTPLGMFPEVNTKPEIPYCAIGEQHLCYDLVYLPEETAFLASCKARGALTKNGLDMLHLQAEQSWDIWKQAMI